MRAKIIALLVLVAMALVITQFSENQRSQPPASELALAPVPEQQLIAPVDTTREFAVHDRPAQALMDVSDHHPVEKAVARASLNSEQLHWIAERGYLTQPPEPDTVDLMLLQAQAQSGALVDVERYAIALMNLGDERARDWLETSAALGSTQALLRLAKLELMRAMDSEHSSAAFDSAATWLRVAALRGDPMADVIANELSLEQEFARVEHGATERYSQLEHRRLGMGIAGFDNHPYPGDNLLVDLQQLHD